MHPHKNQILKTFFDLLKTEKKFGIVENFETETQLRNKGKKSTDFYIKFVGLEKKLKVGRVFYNYDDLIETIKKGDSLTIYCKEKEKYFFVKSWMPCIVHYTYCTQRTIYKQLLI